MEESFINSDSYIPLYEQVRLQLMEQITSGTWDDGSPLPSETKLAERFGVSRITIRQAVAEIARKGFLYKKQGKGTFVRVPDVYQLVGGAHSFLKNAEGMGSIPRTELAASEWKAAELPVAEKLHIPAGEQILFIRLLRYMDEELVGWQEIHTSPEIGSLVDLDELIKLQSLSLMLRVKGKWVVETRVEQGARLAGKKDVAFLHCPDHGPILYSTFEEYGPGGTIYCWSEAAFRADKFKWIFKVGGT